MTKSEALEMLKNAVRSDEPARINPILTRKQAVEMIERGVMGFDEQMFSSSSRGEMMIKRVYQVCRNQKKPRY